MSATLLARLQRIDRETRNLHMRCRRDFPGDRARYPRDYYRPVDLLRYRRCFGPGL